MKKIKHFQLLQFLFHIFFQMKDISAENSKLSKIFQTFQFHDRKTVRFKCFCRARNYKRLAGNYKTSLGNFKVMSLTISNKF